MSNDIIVRFEDEEDIEIKLENRQFSKLQSKTVYPSEQQQIVEKDSGYDALNKVIVEPILLQNKNASPSNTDQIIQADEGYNGLKQVNIRAMRLELYDITPRTYEQTLTPTQNYDALGRVKIKAVTSAIDSNIQAENIKNGVTILGVTGTYDTPSYEGSYNVTENGTLPTANKKMAQDLVVNVADKIDELVSNTITTYSSQNVTSIPSYKFQNCKDLESVNLPNVNSIFGYCFYSCTKLSSVNIPNLTTVSGSYCFASNSALESVNFPKLTTVGSSMFSACDNLKNINIPMVTKIISSGFARTHIINQELPSVTTIEGQAFNLCSFLEKLTLNSNQVCSLQNVSAFSNAGRYNTNPNNIIYIYVPSNLVESYKVATNWSTLYNDGKIEFRAITE